MGVKAILEALRTRFLSHSYPGPLTALSCPDPYWTIFQDTMSELASNAILNLQNGMVHCLSNKASLYEK
jgi:hypothetical protein